MRNFLTKAFLFIVFPLIFILASDIILRNQNSLYKEKYEGAKGAKDSIEVLILGTSQATYGIDPEAFDLYAYNIANLAQSIYFDKRITLSLLPDLPKLKYVFISIGYHSLAFSSQFNRDFWSYYGNGIKYEGTNYFFANLSPTLFGYTPKVSYSMHKKRIMNRLRYGKTTIDFEVQDDVDLFRPVVKGYIAFDGRDTTNFSPESFDFLSNAYTEIIEESEEKEEVIADLEDFIQKLKAEDITPILITIPTYTEFNKYLRTKYVDENIEVSKRLAKEHNIEFWNFYDSDKFDIEDFHDMDHLNREGALKFSAMLNDSINNLKSKKYIAKNK